MFVAALVVLFIVVPIAELYVIIQVGGAIGVLPTVGLLLLDSLLGAMLLKWQGGAAWRRFNETLTSGRVPTREVADGSLIIFGGALLLTPGFLTDILGMLLLLPPTRMVVRSALLRWGARRVTVAVAGPAGAAAFGRAGRARPSGPRARSRYDVDGTAVEVDGATLER
jgi:UPF0716 protein FxsA